LIPHRKFWRNGRKRKKKFRQYLKSGQKFKKGRGGKMGGDLSTTTTDYESVSGEPFFTSEFEEVACKTTR